MDLNDPLYEMFVNQLKSCGWKGKGVGKNEDGKTDINIKTQQTTLGIGATQKDVLFDRGLDDIYSGKSSDVYAITFEKSKTAFDKYDTVSKSPKPTKDDSEEEHKHHKHHHHKHDKESKKSKKGIQDIEVNKEKKYNAIDSTDLSMQFGGGLKQKGKLARIMEQEKKVKKED